MRLAIAFVSIAIAVSAVSQAAPRCAVTEAPRNVFVPPPPYEASPPQGTFYFGSDALWLFLPNDGVWETLRDGANYERRKIAWFSSGYFWLSQSQKDLRVEAKRLDGAETVHGEPATNGFLQETQESFMLNGIAFPATGCWEVSAKYHGNELKFIVWVTPPSN